MPEARISQWYWQTLAKRLQVGSLYIEVPIVQPHGRHLRSRLDGVRILDPEPQHLRSVRRRACGNRGATHEVSQVGAKAAFGRRTGYGVAVDARCRFKDSLSG